MILHRRIWTGAVRAARAGAIAQTVLSFSFARPFGLAHAVGRAIGLRTTVGADAAVLFETRSLPGGAFFLGLRWATVTLAVTGPTRAILRKGSKSRAAHQ